MNPTNQKHKKFESMMADLKKRLSGVQRSASGRPSKGIPAELRQAAVAVWKVSGESKEVFGRRIGVTGTSITNWERSVAAARKVHSRRKPKDSRSSKGNFKPVRVVPERGPAVTSVGNGKTLCMELGSGARITGLSIEDVARLIQAGGGVR